MPWQRIVSGTENLAQSHETLAAKIETDVETPLRQYQTRSREMTGMATIQGNLASISRDVENAHRKADKLKEKGNRGDKYANAANNIDGASREWESQAPYVFEQLQALDESRCNHLRDVLTQFQTHEIDQVERNRVSAESCLNALLNVETADEIKTFAARVTAGRVTIARRPSSATASTARPLSAAGPPAPPPPRKLTESYSQQSGLNVTAEDRLTPLQGKKSSLSGLKRGLGTVIGRRKSQAPLPPGVSEKEKEKKKGSRASFAPFRRGESSQSFQDLERTGRDLTPVTSQEERRPSQIDRSFMTPTSVERPYTQDGGDGPTVGESTRPNGQPDSRTTVSRDDNAVGESTHRFAEANLRNGIEPDRTDQVEPSIRSTNPATTAEVFQPPPGPPPAQTHLPQELSALPATPDITSPTSIYSTATSQFDSAVPTSPEGDENAARNLMIRDQPIPEDATEAQQAMSNMANQLRMQAPIARMQGSVRGRRDVRNTVFVPNAVEWTPQSSSAVSGAVVGGGVVGAVAGVASSTAAAELASPIKHPSTPGTIPEDRAVSDTASLHSSHSLATIAQHPVLEGPGLNASIIETVSTWFTEGSISKSFVVGEIALAINGLPEDDTETLRISNFHILEKVAANPTFVHSPISDKGKEKEGDAGEYIVDVHAIRKSAPTVALKYQVHLDAALVATYSPILITPAWQCQPGQVSVIVLYALNPAFIGASTEVILKNVVITVSLDTADGTKANSAMMSPTTGASFKRKSGAVVWRMSELSVKPAEQQEKLLVRFVTNTPSEGTPKKGTVEAKWEYEQTAAGGAEQLGVTRLEEVNSGEDADPFADEGEPKSNKSWTAVNTRRKLISGRYSAL